jgi:glycerate-2-kinase
MEIRNKLQLLGNSTSPEIRKLRCDALDILKAAVEEVDPKRAILGNLIREGDHLRASDIELDLGRFRRIVVVGGGKAGGAMAEALEELLGDRISAGAMNILRGTAPSRALDRIELHEASHPIPSEDGARGVARMLELVEGLNEDDLVIVLISGGGSALMADPAEGIDLEELRRLTDMLLRCGATINELNAVRKHLSIIKGGQLARRAYPATILGLIISDVVGDPLDVIASGPTAPDPTTYQDAYEILRRYGLWDQAATSIRSRIMAGLRGEAEETPKPGEKTFDRVFNLVIGSNMTAAGAAACEASALGYKTLILSTRVEGEARHVGGVLGGIAREIATSGNPIPPPAAIIAGGETTVTVTGRGKGGRNQEAALGSALKIEGLNASIACLATDGIDGPTDAAGAIVDGSTIGRARAMGLSPLEYLRDNDSYGFFQKLGDLIFTGPTGTNVNDLTVILVSGD